MNVVPSLYVKVVSALYMFSMVTLSFPKKDWPEPKVIPKLFAAIVPILIVVILLSSNARLFIVLMLDGIINEPIISQSLIK